MKPFPPDWNYSVISEKSYHENIGEYDTYGIEVTGPRYAMVLHDVSLDEEIVIHMAKLFNEHQLMPVHFRDVVDDMLP